MQGFLGQEPRPLILHERGAFFQKTHDVFQQAWKNIPAYPQKAKAEAKAKAKAKAEAEAKAKAEAKAANQS